MQKFDLPTGFSVGSAKINVNPPLGISIAGYYIPRFAYYALCKIKNTM